MMDTELIHEIMKDKIRINDEEIMSKRGWCENRNSGDEKKEKLELGNFYLMKMKSCKRQYLEKVESQSDEKILRRINLDYQHYREQLNNVGIDISTLPETLEELTK